MPKKTQKGSVDLHNLNAEEALQVFIEYYNRRVQSGLNSPIEVLHGYGSHGEGGKVIKKRIRGFLNRYPQHATFESGRIHGGLYDATTIVYPQKALPTQEDRLAEEMLIFCSNKKSEEKIFNKFRRHGDQKVRATLRRLKKSGSLVVKRGRLKFYESA